MAEDLPTEFDVIVIGTGLSEAITAAALTRIGKRVLHIDKNDYYGGQWAAFTFDKLLAWIEKNQNLKPGENTPSLYSQDDDPSQKRLLLPNDVMTTLNVEMKCYCDETPVTVKDNSSAESDVVDNEMKAEIIKNQHDTDIDENSKSQDPSSQLDQINSDQIVGEENSKSQDCNMPNKDNSDPVINDKERREYSYQDLKDSWRRFSIDLLPKLLLCRGSLVDLLIKSKVARYVEFKCVTKILTYKRNELVQVPCSRSEVFSSTLLSMLEKRILMKFLNFCLDYEKHEDKYKDYEQRPFSDYLNSCRLSKDLQHFVIHCIAMVKGDTTTVEGLAAAQRFLKSLGRFGETPFLWPLYGVAELPQAFCRLCAVFGGIYCLRMNVPELIMDESSHRCIGIITDEGQRISCSNLIIDSSYLPSALLSDETNKENSISRAIFITDKSIHPSETDEVVLLSIPSSDYGYLIHALEISSGSMACPEDVVHLTCSMKASAKEDLGNLANLLFNFKGTEEQHDIRKPTVLWCTYFNQVCYDVKEELPSNIFTINPIDSEIDFESLVAKAEKLYRKICPDDDFIPSPPDPEDIIIDDTVQHNNANENKDSTGFSNYEESAETQVEGKDDEGTDTKLFPAADET